MKKSYQPHPIDVSDTELPECLDELQELLAKNTHEVWSAGRIHEGWTYGPVRNDQKKQTPCLQSYENLSPEEQAYDRNTAMNTIRLLIKLGYKILPPEK